MALAAMDRKIADAEREPALPRVQRELMRSLSGAAQRTASRARPQARSASR